MRNLLYTIVAAYVVLVSACSAPQKTIYFAENSAIDPSVQVQHIDRLKEITIQPDDIVAIHVTTISSLTEKTPVSIFNDGGTAFSVTATAGGAGAAGGGGSQNNGYLVDPNGNIDFPVVGKMKVGGLNLRQAKESIALKLKDYVRDPVVEVRIINYKITVLGEVNHPGTVVAPNQKLSVIEALAAAGDIPITGRKDNVLIVRENEGTREFARLDLNSKNVFASPYYYLRQNDIVYVTPARVRRQQSNEFLQFYLPTITSLLSTVLAVYGITQISK